MDFGAVLKRAGQITWRYKVLWIFGFFLALCSQGGQFSSGFNFEGPMPSRYEPEMPGEMPEFPSFFPEPLGQTPLMILVAIIVGTMILFFIVSLVVWAIGQGALIKSVDRIENDETVTFSQGWSDGLATLSPLALLHMLFLAPIYLMAMVGIFIFFSQVYPQLVQILQYPEPPPEMINNLLMAFPLLISAGCIFVCFSFIIQLAGWLFTTLGSRAIVLEESDIFASLSRSWQLFRANLGQTLLLGLIGYMAISVVRFVVGMIMAIPMMVIAFLMMPQILSEGGPSLWVYPVMAGMGVIIFLISSVVNGILRTFIESMWTLAYNEFAQRTADKSQFQV